ncbi:S41 family peptidase [Erythrobacter rubeus]|uniref:Peptidase S41 n=1 Tax=Erythrobacter rubeus TaxID=2760803 RepID=A0ABR8KS17_9SPHN|nr:S41 family peptidase [Erythrobacter rubeus]MBD2840901.1 peptidase S41 [Erythrobacter rubeus]
MQIGRSALSATLALALAACGGGGGSSTSTTSNSPAPTPTPTPPPVQTGCSISEQQQVAFDIIDEWYLFPDLIAQNVDPADFTTTQGYINALTEPAREAGKDDFFNFVTVASEEDALIESGSTAGFGIRLSYDTVNNRVFLVEAYENGSGFGAGMDRGTEILAIGTSSANLETVSSLMASGGPQAVVDALGPTTAGTARVLRFAQVDGAIVEANITKTEFSLDPLSDRYGALTLSDGGKLVGYINLRTFIVDDATEQLSTAFSQFGSQGIDEVIIDLRYNGGGLVRVAEALGNLLGRDEVGNVFSQTVWRESKSDRNRTTLFESTSNALAPAKLVFITTRSSASASELIANSMRPYFADSDIALVGTNTSGKPVGQSGFDVESCDLRFRIVTFKTDNAVGEGEYFDGLAPFFATTCRANDDITVQLGDPSEASIAAALDFLGGRTCTPISGTTGLTVQSVGGREILQPVSPSAAQHEIPGLF